MFIAVTKEKKRKKGERADGLWKGEQNWDWGRRLDMTESDWRLKRDKQQGRWGGTTKSNSKKFQ